MSINRRVKVSGIVAVLSIIAMIFSWQGITTNTCSTSRDAMLATYWDI